MTTLRIPAEQPLRQAGHDHQTRTVPQTVRVGWVRARRALPAGEDPDGHVL
jgi:hypothetical protein